MKMGTLICAKCRAIPVDGVCPLCGKNKKFIEAGDNDEVYLTSCEYIWSRMVEDALDGAGIRYRRHGTHGSGVIASIGELAELYRYYVMFPDYGAARAVVPDTDFGEMSEEELLEYMEEYSENDGCPEDCDAPDGSEK